MSRTLRVLAAILMVVGLLAGTASVAGASAPAPGSIPGGEVVFLPAVAPGAVIQVQNVGDIAAQYEVCYEYAAGCQDTAIINPGSAGTILAPADSIAASPFTGIMTGSAYVFQIAPVVNKVVVAAPFAVTVDRIGVMGGTSATPDGGNTSYTGVSGVLLPMDTGEGYWLYAPVVFSGFNGWSSIIRVQNAQLVPAQFSIWFYDVNGNPVNTISNMTLPPLGSAAIDPAVPPAGVPAGTYSAWIRVTGAPGNPAGFFGAAVVVDNFKGGIATSYRGEPWDVAAPFPHPLPFPISQFNQITGETALYAPLVFKSFNQWNAGIRVTNITNSVHAQVKVVFRDAAGTIVAQYLDDIDRQSFKDYFFQDMNLLPQNFVGSATVETQPYSPAGHPTFTVPIIAVVQQSKWTGDASFPKNASGYNTINWNQGGDVLASPFAAKYATNAFSTGLQIMNMDRTPGTTDVNIDLFDAAGRIWSTQEDLGPMNTVGYDLRNIADAMIPRGFIGSAVAWVFSSTQMSGGYLGGIVSEVSFAANLSDGGKAYEMFPLSQAEVAPAQACVVGQVLDTAGNPIVGLTVTLKDEAGNVVATAVTDATGDYRLCADTEGIFFVSLPACTGVAAQKVALNFAAVATSNFTGVSLANCTFIKDFLIKNSVTGAPISGATITFTAGSVSGTVPEIGNGVYQGPVVAVLGPVTFTVSAPGFVTQVITEAPAAVGGTLENLVNLVPCAFITGTVVDALSNPISGAAITAVGLTGGTAQMALGATTTDKNGAFVLSITDCAAVGTKVQVFVNGQLLTTVILVSGENAVGTIKFTPAP